MVIYDGILIIAHKRYNIDQTERDRNDSTIETRNVEGSDAWFNLERDIREKEGSSRRNGKRQDWKCLALEKGKLHF